MNQYLLQILKETNTIIIPDLGALTITNEKTGEIMFMSYLKFDDGKLINYIASKDGVEKNDAKNIVAKYVREIKSKLDKGESYDMFQFGSFFKNEEGEIDFKNWNASSSSVKTVKTVETEEKIVETLIEEKQTPSIEDVLPPKNDEEVKEDEKTPTDSQKSIDEILSKSTIEDEAVVNETPPRIEVIIEKPIEKKSEEVTSKSTAKIDENIYFSPEELKELEQKEAVKKTTSKLKDKPAAKEKKKRGVGFIILLILIGLISLSAIGTAIFYQQIKSLIPFLNETKKEIQLEEKEIVDEIENSLDEVYQDTLEMNTQDSESELQPEKIEKIEEKSTPTPSPSIQQGGGFHVIGGSFSSEANARRFVEELKAKNIAAEYIGKYGMYLVSLGSYNSSAEATQAMKASGQTGWIKKI